MDKGPSKVIPADETVPLPGRSVAISYRVVAQCRQNEKEPYSALGDAEMRLFVAYSVWVALATYVA